MLFDGEESRRSDYCSSEKTNMSDIVKHHFSASCQTEMVLRWKKETDKSNIFSCVTQFDENSDFGCVA